MLCWLNPNPTTDAEIHLQKLLRGSNSVDKMDAAANAEFPPPGYRPTPINHLLVNALDLTAPASDALLQTRKNAWVQVAGHPGSFAPASLTTIWKKRLNKDNYETAAYHDLMNDAIKDMVPKFHREVEYGGQVFIEIEDLLQHFTDPSILDIKMGTRTFLESEVNNPLLRKDLYDKMVKLNANEPTAAENEQKAITKLRYMQFRERDSSTSVVGFRLEAMKMPGQKPNTHLKRIKGEAEVKQNICYFLQGHKDVQKKILKRLKEMRRKLEMSKFFKHHEMIGSSLLLLYDHHKHVSGWMIDFAKTLVVENSVLNHRSPWKIGNHEDGYLEGLDNLIRLFSELNMDAHLATTEHPSVSTTCTSSTNSHCSPTPPTSSNHHTNSIADASLISSIEVQSCLCHESNQDSFSKRRKSQPLDNESTHIPNSTRCGPVA